MTTHEVAIVPPHLIMLTGDYPLYASLSHSCSCEPYCRICPNCSNSDTFQPIEDIIHVLTSCRATRNTRSRVFPDLLNTVADHFPTNNLLAKLSLVTTTQFIIDCSSLNLNNDIRNSPAHPPFILTTKQCIRDAFKKKKQI